MPISEMSGGIAMLPQHFGECHFRCAQVAGIRRGNAIAGRLASGKAASASRAAEGRVHGLDGRCEQYVTKRLLVMPTSVAFMWGLARWTCSTTWKTSGVVASPWSPNTRLAGKSSQNQEEACFRGWRL